MIYRGYAKRALYQMSYTPFRREVEGYDGGYPELIIFDQAGGDVQAMKI
jgi:hypothetical protein